MKESQKTQALRSQAFREAYFRGRIIDIGSGTETVCPEAEPFDMADGDANRILDFREAGAYDCVHSSHCLEHMLDPETALLQWWGLLRPGGHLVLVVPEENLYEQGYWPSLFNADHKHTFRLDGAASWSPVSRDLRALCARLPGARVLEAEIQRAGYREGLRKRPGALPRAGLRWRMARFMAIQRGRARRIPIAGPLAEGLAVGASLAFGCPVDQTLGNAVAQIQVVVRKDA
ncbi:MAG TPA: methyltransferase domain-containing protein [Holophagaceae bacterium]|nr:methyltransferase domain-containing protein [Holophagaceae bacterium]